MALFGKDDAATPQQGGPSAADIINQMKEQGYSNNQIVEYMQKEGFKSNEIFDAMNKLDAGPVPGSPQMPQGAIHGPEMMPPMPPSQNMSKEEIEEISESIVDERLEDFKKDLTKLNEWKEATEAKVIVFEQKLVDMQKSFDDLHQGVLGKIEEYDKGIVDVGTEIKALEKVFTKILPTLTENVGELSRITQKMKENTPVTVVKKK